MRIAFCFSIFLISLSSFSQDPQSYADSTYVRTLDEFYSDEMDSTKLEVLRLEDFIALVLANHPVVRQANLQELYAEAELRMARGMFDPKLTSSLNAKNFKDTEYYNMFNTTLKIPTWFPVDPKLTVDRNTGVYLGEDLTIPEENQFRQIGAGLSIPLGKGLFIDERRLAVRQAQAFRGIALAEQVKMTNKILFTAIKDYWNWWESYQRLTYLLQSMNIAEELFERVLLDYGFGEAAVVDTVQAKITYQTRMTDYEQTRLDYIKAGLALAVHLWSEEGYPVELQPNVVPDTLADFGVVPTDSAFLQLINFAMDYHPEVRKLDGKIEQLEVENRWNVESLKPQVDLSYTFIDAPINPFGDFAAPEWNDNYKLGFDFSFPIFLRKERGKLQKTQLKIQENELYRNQIRQEIRNGISATYYEIITNQRLSSQFQSMAENYFRLLEAEFLNLETGESDLFKLNIQQDKYIESQLKYLKTLTKYQKSKAAILYDAGVPFLSLTN
jgi:outer membrane protein TolC